MVHPPIVSDNSFRQLACWSLKPLDFLETNHQRYGDIFTARIGPRIRFTLVADPSAIATIFTTDPSTLDAGRSNEILRPTVGDFSLLILDGPAHERQRKLLMPPFHGDRMRSYSTDITQITKAALQDLQGSLQPDEAFNTRDLMQRISFQVILQTVFGLDRNTPGQRERSDRFLEAIQALVEFGSSPYLFATAFFPQLRRPWGGLWRPWVYFQRLLRSVDQAIYETVSDRRSATHDLESTDILSLLLAARDEDGQPMTDQELRDELITLLIAGHETTATALSWAMYWIHKLPEVREKVLAELAELPADIDGMAVAKLPYLNAVCSEVLRIYPIAMVVTPRIAKAAIKVGDYDCDAGSLVVPCIYLTHRRPDLYPDPTTFRPERFLERQFSPSEYFPFGGNNRRCIGSAFALLEMKLVLATLLRTVLFQNRRFELAGTELVLPTRRGVTIAPKGGVMLRLIDSQVRGCLQG